MRSYWTGARGVPSTASTRRWGQAARGQAPTGANLGGDGDSFLLKVGPTVHIDIDAKVGNVGRVPDEKMARFLQPRTHHTAHPSGQHQPTRQQAVNLTGPLRSASPTGGIEKHPMRAGGGVQHRAQTSMHIDFLAQEQGAHGRGRTWPRAHPGARVRQAHVRSKRTFPARAFSAVARVIFGTYHAADDHDMAAVAVYGCAGSNHRSARVAAA